jgi:hypothetical protein
MDGSSLRKNRSNEPFAVLSRTPGGMCWTRAALRRVVFARAAGPQWGFRLAETRGLALAVRRGTT